MATAGSANAHRRQAAAAQSAAVAALWRDVDRLATQRATAGLKAEKHGAVELVVVAGHDRFQVSPPSVGELRRSCERGYR